jgi:hypothetical protein
VHKIIFEKYTASEALTHPYLAFDDDSAGGGLIDTSKYVYYNEENRSKMEYELVYYKYLVNSSKYLVLKSGYLLTAEQQKLLCDALFQCEGLISTVNVSFNALLSAVVHTRKMISSRIIDSLLNDVTQCLITFLYVFSCADKYTHILKFTSTSASTSAPAPVPISKSLISEIYLKSLKSDLKIEYLPFWDFIQHVAIVQRNSSSSIEYINKYSEILCEMCLAYSIIYQGADEIPYYLVCAHFMGKLNPVIGELFGNSSLAKRFPTIRDYYDNSTDIPINMLIVKLLQASASTSASTSASDPAYAIYFTVLDKLYFDVTGNHITTVNDNVIDNLTFDFQFTVLPKSTDTINVVKSKIISACNAGLNSHIIATLVAAISAPISINQYEILECSRDTSKLTESMKKNIYTEYKNAEDPQWPDIIDTIYANSVVSRGFVDRCDKNIQEIKSSSQIALH